METISRGQEQGASTQEMCETMLEVAHAASCQARSALFAPSVSEPALVVEAALRVDLLAQAGRIWSVSVVAGAVPQRSLWRNGA